MSCFIYKAIVYLSTIKNTRIHKYMSLVNVNKLLVNLVFTETYVLKFMNHL